MDFEKVRPETGPVRSPAIAWLVKTLRAEPHRSYAVRGEPHRTYLSLPSPIGTKVYTFTVNSYS